MNLCTFLKSYHQVGISKCWKLEQEPKQELSPHPAMRDPMQGTPEQRTQLIVVVKHSLASLFFLFLGLPPIFSPNLITC